MSLPHDPDARLRRNELAMALTECGYPIAASTLSWYACMGGGPPFQKFSRYPIYPWGSSLEWAQSRLSRVVRTTSELSAGQRGAPVSIGDQPAA